MTVNVRVVVPDNKLSCGRRGQNVRAWRLMTDLRIDINCQMSLKLYGKAGQVDYAVISKNTLEEER